MHRQRLSFLPIRIEIIHVQTEERSAYRAFLDQLARHFASRVGRYSPVNTKSAAIAGGANNADHLAVDVCERSAGVARTDLCVSLNQRNVVAELTDDPVDTTDEADRDGM